MVPRTPFQPPFSSQLLVLALLVGGFGCTSVHSPNVEIVPTRPIHMGGAALTYAVWTPPDFSEDEQLPLVLFLHGAGDNPRSFERAGLADAMAAATREGDMPRVVMVFPAGDVGFWRNWHDGTRHYEDWIMRELLPDVTQRWHTGSCPEHCHVMGVSMGGSGAMAYALHHPNSFASATSISGLVLDATRVQQLMNSRLLASIIPMRRIFGPPHPISRLSSQDLFHRWTTAEEVGMPLLVAWSREDRRSIRESNERFDQHLTEHEVPHGVIQFEGGHSWAGWTPVIQQAIRIQIGGESITSPMTIQDDSPAQVETTSARHDG